MYNYPNKKKSLKNQENLSNLNKRGLDFEEEINMANEYYVSNDIAHIYKKPTPIKVLKVKNTTESFTKRTKIIDAFFEKKSTTDYNGIYKGRYVDFEAKESKEKSFNLKVNLHAHQKEHLYSVSRHGGIAFLIINMKKYGKVFIVEISKINKEQDKLDYEFLQDYGYEVNQDSTIYLDYLKIVDRLIGE